MAQPPLSDSAIREVAARILQTSSSPADVRATLARFPDLSPDDERRVLTALSQLRHDGPEAEGQADGSAAQPPRPVGSDHTPQGTAARSTQGYGTAQGASGATSGGADPGGSVNSSDR